MKISLTGRVADALAAILEDMNIRRSEAHCPYMLKPDVVACDLAPIIVRALEAAHADGAADDWGGSIGLEQAVMPELLAPEYRER